jgi:predicted methyltransferase
VRPGSVTHQNGKFGWFGLDEDRSSDERDWNDSPRSVAPEKRGTSDRFALRFVKP